MNLTLFRLADGTATAPSLTFASQPTLGFFKPFSSAIGFVGTTPNPVLLLSADTARGFEAAASYPFSWSQTSANAGDVADTFMWRDGAANVVGIRNSTSGQRFNVNNTFTSLVNREDFSVDWQTTAGTALVGTRTAATGTQRRLFLVSQGTNAATGFSGISIIRGAAPDVRIGLYGADGLTPTTTNASEFLRLGEYTNTLTSGTVTSVTIQPTYNQAAASTANTDLLINRTETSVGSGVQYLIDAQVAGATKFNVDNGGNLTVPSGVTHATDYITSSGNGSNGGSARSFTKVLLKTAIANAVATDVFTVTIPNSAQTAGIHVLWTCALGAGGAIGANEGATIAELNYIVTRTAGVNAAVAASTSAGVGVANINVTGGTTATLASSWSAVAGAVGATNTATIQVTLTRGASTSTNHQCLAAATLTNMNASGVTLQ